MKEKLEKGVRNSKAEIVVVVVYTEPPGKVQEETPKESLLKVAFKF
jgi:hypothetical protein